MAEHLSQIRPADDDEAERYMRLRDVDLAGPLSWLRAGARAAHETVLPAITSGGYGYTGREMERGIRAVMRAGLKALDEESSDDRFLWRLGFEAVALQAKDDALMAVGIGAGLALATVAAAAPHALAMPAPPTRRPLRPEDFGALPSRPRT